MTATLPQFDLPAGAEAIRPFSLRDDEGYEDRYFPAELRDGRRTVRVEDPALDVADGWTTIYNLSLGGMCIVTLRRLNAGDVATIELLDRSSRRGYTLKAEVVWENPVTDDLRKLGVRWLDLDGEARQWLSKFVD